MSALPYAHKELYENDTLDISIYAGKFITDPAKLPRKLQLRYL